jgi:hypothetical protein
MANGVDQFFVVTPTWNVLVPASFRLHGARQ